MSGKAYRKKQREKKSIQKESITKAKKIQKRLNDRNLFLKKRKNRKGDTSNISLTGKCSICGFTGGKTVRHHITPAWLGDNSPGNLIELCIRCHSNIHKLAEDMFWKNVSEKSTKNVEKVKNDLLLMLKSGTTNRK